MSLARQKLSPEHALSRPPRARILVLLACYNGSPWISEQVDSILVQEDVDISLVIGDDNSKDDTILQLHKRYGRDPRVSVRQFAEGSGSAGANFRRLISSASLAECDYVAFSDQDDVWDSRKLRVAVRQLEVSGCAGYSCAVSTFGDGIVNNTLRQCAAVTKYDYLFEGAGQGCTFVFTVELASRVQAFLRSNGAAASKMHFHDWMTYLLCRVWGYSWFFDTASYMRYRQHGGNEIGARGGIAAAVRRIRLIRDGWYRSQVCAALDLRKAAVSCPNEEASLPKILRADQSLKRRLLLCRYLATQGRRRRSDRLVLMVAALLGWM